MVQNSLSVFYKDLRSEWRTRQSFFALLLFLVNSVVLLLFATKGLRLGSELFSGVLWIILLFSSSVGMAKSFVSEEDRGTTLYLQLVSSPTKVFLGKFLYNLLLSVFMLLSAAFLSVELFDLSTVASPGLFLAVLLGGGCAVSVAMTMSAALIARAQAKGALLPVLSFPLILPVLFLGVDATSMAVVGTPDVYIWPSVGIMLSYAVVLFIVALWLFPYLWMD